MNKEVLKFEAAERALKLEIERNPIPCGYCSMWQSGGEMSRALFKCDKCGERRAKGEIQPLIQKLMLRKKITYEKAWNLAFEFLTKKIKKAPYHIYYDEDYFYMDLKKRFRI